MGTIILPVTLGQPPAQIKWFTKFLVVDTPSAYNIILARPFLVRTKSVLSIYHHVLKFPHLAKKCYAASTNPTTLLKHCVQVTTKNDKPMQEESMETEVEEYLEVLEKEDEKRIPRGQERGTPVDNLKARRESIAKSSSHTSNNHFKHFRRSSEVCNHCSGLLHMMGKSQVFGVNHKRTNHQFPPTVDCI
ncbi:hypothetical protein ACOSP7_020902 [Xanthoceras sorbifolium]